MTFISYDDFAKIDLRVARILSAERIITSEKLLKLRVSLENEERQIIAGIGKSYAPEDLLGKLIVIVANLEPRKLMGEESEGMLLAASGPEGLPILLTLFSEGTPGSKIR